MERVTRMFDRLTMGLWMVSAGLVAALLMAASLDARQAPPEVKPAPMLAVEQKQAIQILAQQIELAQLRAQVAQNDFNKASRELATLLQSLQKDGFDLNLQTMEYTKKPEPTKAPEKKKDGSQ